MTTKFTDQSSWQFSKTIHKIKSKREKRHIVKKARTQSPYITSAYSRPLYSSRYSPKPTDKDHDKYNHVDTYSDETIIKHPSLRRPKLRRGIALKVTLKEWEKNGKTT